MSGSTRSQDPHEAWRTQRDAFACNVGPVNGVRAKSTITRSPARSEPLLFARASDNLCIAQALRANVSASATLLLSAPEQRQLTNVIRERAQTAMLAYARASLALSDAPGAGPAAGEAKVWLSNPANHSMVTVYARELATATRLHGRCHRGAGAHAWP